jgi:uncharacterized protein YbaR (Trm112 family)
MNGGKKVLVMSISQELLEILVCPETKQPLTVAAETLVAQLNERIAQGTLTNRTGDTVTEAIDSGLVREDGRYLYPVRDDIPIMLIDEAIAIDA